MSTGERRDRVRGRVALQEVHRVVREGHREDGWEDLKRNIGWSNRTTAKSICLSWGVVDSEAVSKPLVMTGTRYHFVLKCAQFYAVCNEQKSAGEMRLTSQMRWALTQHYSLMGLVKGNGAVCSGVSREFGVDMRVRNVRGN